MRYMRDSASPRKRFVGFRNTDTYRGYFPVTKRCRLMLDDLAMSVRCVRDNPRRDDDDEDGDDGDDDGDGDDIGDDDVFVELVAAAGGTDRR